MRLLREKPDLPLPEEETVLSPTRDFLLDPDLGCLRKELAEALAEVSHLRQENSELHRRAEQQQVALAAAEAATDAARAQYTSTSEELEKLRRSQLAGLQESADALAREERQRAELSGELERGQAELVQLRSELAAAQGREQSVLARTEAAEKTASAEREARLELEVRAERAEVVARTREAAAAAAEAEGAQRLLDLEEADRQRAALTELLNETISQKEGGSGYKSELLERQLRETKQLVVDMRTGMGEMSQELTQTREELARERSKHQEAKQAGLRSEKWAKTSVIETQELQTQVAQSTATAEYFQKQYRKVQKEAEEFKKKALTSEAAKTHLEQHIETLQQDNTRLSTDMAELRRTRATTAGQSVQMAADDLSSTINRDAALRQKHASATEAVECLNAMLLMQANGSGNATEEAQLRDRLGVVLASDHDLQQRVSYLTPAHMRGGFPPPQ